MSGGGFGGFGNGGGDSKEDDGLYEGFNYSIDVNPVPENLGGLNPTSQLGARLMTGKAPAAMSRMVTAGGTEVGGKKSDFFDMEICIMQSSCGVFLAGPPKFDTIISCITKWEKTKVKPRICLSSNILTKVS